MPAAVRLAVEVCFSIADARTILAIDFARRRTVIFVETITAVQLAMLSRGHLLKPLDEFFEGRKAPVVNVQHLLCIVETLPPVRAARKRKAVEAEASWSSLGEAALEGLAPLASFFSRPFLTCFAAFLLGRFLFLVLFDFSPSLEKASESDAHQELSEAA